MRLLWKPRALRQLEAVAKWSQKQARAVVDTIATEQIVGFIRHLRNIINPMYKFL